MIAAIKRNGTFVVGVAACGFLCAAARPFALSPRGASGPTFLQAESPVAAVVALTVAAGLATAVAVVVGRVINTAVALFVLGAGFFVLAHGMETVRDLAFAGGSLTWLAIETLLLAGLLLAAVAVVFRLSGPLPDIHPREGRAEAESVWGARALGAAAAAGLIVLPVVWLVAQSPLKGQAIGAVFVGSMVAGLAGRLLSPHVQPLLLFVSPLVFGAVGHLLAAARTGDPLDAAYVAGGLSHLSYPMPIDYLAGTLMGVAVGLGWARSFLHHDGDEEPEPAAAGG